MNRRFTSSLSPSGESILLIAAFLYSLYAVLSREAATMFGDNSQATMRQMVGFLFVLCLAALTSSLRMPPPGHRWKLFAISISGAPMGLMFTYSVNHLELADAISLMFAGQIIGGSVLGASLFGEGWDRCHVLSVIACLAGLACYSGRVDLVDFDAGIALLAGFTMAASSALYRWVGSMDRKTVLVWQFGVGSLIGATVVAVSGEVVVHTFHTSALIANIAYGLLILLVGYVVLVGFNKCDINKGNVILAAELPLAVLYGIAFYSEPVTLVEGLGSVLIGSGLIVSVFKPIRHDEGDSPGGTPEIAGLESA